MARPEPRQLDPPNYPVSLVTQTRFQDIDPNRHFNNVAFATMFENASVRFNRWRRQAAPDGSCNGIEKNADRDKRKN